MEGVGEIIDVGEQVNGLFPGDRVAYMSRTPGAYADIRCIDADACMPLPDGLSDIEASMLLKGVTAALLLEPRVQGRPGRDNPDPGGFRRCGPLAQPMGQIHGPHRHRHGIHRRESQVQPGPRLRPPHCGRGRCQPLAAEVMRITNGRGVDYWVHSSGAHGLDAAVACLSRCGHCAVIGDRDEQPIPIDVNVLKQRSLTVSAPVCFDYFDDRSYLQRLAHQLFAKIQSRTIIPAIEAFPLSQAAEAHNRIEARQTMGAVVLTPGG